MRRDVWYIRELVCTCTYLFNLPLPNKINPRSLNMSTAITQRNVALRVTAASGTVVARGGDLEDRFFRSLDSSLGPYTYSVSIAHRQILRSCNSPIMTIVLSSRLTVMSAPLSLRRRATLAPFDPTILGKDERSGRVRNPT